MIPAISGVSGGEGWRLGFQSLEDEIAPPRELEIAGSMPRELSGTLYRIGPARFDVYGDRVHHWFDGDGMVHAFRFADGGVTYTNRFVATHDKLTEDRFERRLYSTFLTPTPGGPLRRFLRRHHHKNPANTNVVFHAGTFFALCEAGWPYRLDADDLSTFGEDNLGVLTRGDFYSGHPKLDEKTGVLWNFGISYGRRSYLNIFTTTSDGATTRRFRLPMPMPAFVHDFALTATKAVFVVPPLVLPKAPLGLLLGQRPFGTSLHFRPRLGTRIGVVDRQSGEARWYQAPPRMLFHTIAAWDEGDELVVDVCACRDAHVIDTLAAVMAPHNTVPLVSGPSWPERFRIARDGSVAHRRLSNVPFEFPRMLAASASSDEGRVFGVSWREGSVYPSTPVAFNLRTQLASFGSTLRGRFAGECVPVRNAGAGGDRCWLLTLVLDAERRRTELHVLDGDDVPAPPVAVAKLPHIVPFGFHGAWVAAYEAKC